MASSRRSPQKNKHKARMNDTTVCIGLPIHNGGSTLRQSIESLLAQTHADFLLVLLDDASSDESAQIAAEYARSDARVSFHANRTRAGLIGAWNRVAELSRTQRPTWFAWFSDHDWVDSEWLARLLSAVEAEPGIVLAHGCVRQLLEPEGRLMEGGSGLDTRSLDRYERLRAVSLAPFGAGDAVYGLIRFAALDACGIFPREILPDRLLVSELTLHGAIAFDPGAIRYRRVYEADRKGTEMIARQLRTLVPDGDEIQCPHLSHCTYFLRRLSAVREVHAESALERIYHALSYFHRHYYKYAQECQEELQASGGCESLREVREFVRNVGDRNWKVLGTDYIGMLEKVKQTKARVDKYRQAYEDAREANRELGLERERLLARIQVLEEAVQDRRGEWM